MRETVVEAVTQGSIRVRVLRVWSGGRRKGPVCGKDLEAPGMRFENGFYAITKEMQDFMAKSEPISNRVWQKYNK